MPFFTSLVRPVLWTGVLALGVVVPIGAAALPEEPAPAAVPAAAVPAAPSPLPVLEIHRLGSRFEAAAPGQSLLVAPAAGSFSIFSTAAAGPGFQPRGFSTRLMSRMIREAARFRRDNVAELTPIQGGALEEIDSLAASRRQQEASRVVTRATHRALREEILGLGRGSLGLTPALDFIDGLSLRRSIGPGEANPPSPGLVGTLPRETLRGDFGLRVDAHPALLFRAQYGSVRGRLELPVLGEPVRLSVESPAGRQGRAVLSAGLPRDGQGWATLTLQFSF